MGNFALQTGPYSFLKLRISPWGNLFILLLCFFSPRSLYPSFLPSLAAASPFPCLLFSSPRGTKSGEQHNTRLGRIQAAAAPSGTGSSGPSSGRRWGSTRAGGGSAREQAGPGTRMATAQPEARWASGWSGGERGLGARSGGRQRK
jgi:hypothetical protein